MPGKNSANAHSLTPEELERALDVKPPSDPQTLEDHVHQLLMRAQVSWLSKRDVLDILTNWQMYNLPISLMPPDQPGPGSLFLFDRTQLKCFRRDNHVWKSKAGGKTVQETHEKLKIEGGIPALNCYYAHSADGTLQRRCYWKLAGNTNIVLMHYRSPNHGKRNSPPTAATPLTVQTRMPPPATYLPAPEPGHPQLHELSDANSVANLSNVRAGIQQGPGWHPAGPGSINRGHGGIKLDRESLRQHSAPDAVGGIPQVGGVPQHMAVQPPPPGDVLPVVHPISADQLVSNNWKGEWHSAHGQMGQHGAWPLAASHDNSYQHVQAQQPVLPIPDSTSIPVPPVVPSPSIQHELPCIDHNANMAVDRATMGKHALPLGDSGGGEAAVNEKLSAALVPSPPDEMARPELNQDASSEGIHLHGHTGVMPSSVPRMDVPEVKLGLEREGKHQNGTSGVPEADAHSGQKRTAEDELDNLALDNKKARMDHGF